MQRPIEGKVSENTWNSRLANALKEHGFQSAEFELGFQTFHGHRKPDVPFKCDRGLCLVSGKLGSNKIIDAISSAAEYKEDFRAVTEIAEVFGLTYPASGEKQFCLYVLPSELHTHFSWELGSLADVVNKVAEVVINQFHGMEPTETSTIRVLRSGVMELSGCLSGIPTEDFEVLFGDQNLFESSLGYAETKAERQVILRTAAAYLFVNQVLFYQVLSAETPDNFFPPISQEDGANPQHLQKRYFEKVLGKDYHAIFDFDVSSKLVSQETKDASKKIVNAIRLLFPGKVEHDIIGKVFHELIPKDTRKVVAAYFTNSSAGDLLARLSVITEDDLVMDPACGSGTLLVSAYRAKSRLSGDKVLTEQRHKKFVEKDLIGVDIMPFSAHLAAINLALQAPLYETDNVQIAIDDSTKYSPAMTINPARLMFKEAFKTRQITDYVEHDKQKMIDRSQKSQRGALSLTQAVKEIALSPVDVVIMNPPFTSCDNLPMVYKEHLKERFQKPAAYAKCLTGKLSLQAYFVLLADRFLKPRGHLACVIPLTTLVGKAFNNLTTFLVENYTIKYIIVGLGRSAFSENTALSEILFIAEKRHPPKGNKFVLIGVKESPTKWSPSDIDNIAKQAVEGRAGKPTDSNIATALTIEQVELSRGKKGLNELLMKFDTEFTDTLVTLHRVYQSRKKVIATGDLEKETGCEFFAYELRIRGGAHYGFSALSISDSIERMKKKSDVLLFQSEDESSVTARNRFTNELVTMPKSCVCKQIRRLSSVGTMEITNDKEFLVSKPFLGLDKLLLSVYPEGQSKVFESRIRMEWEEKVMHGVSNIVLARRIDLAAPGTRHLSLYSESPMFLSANSWGIRNLKPDDAKILCLWFNSSFFLMEIFSKRTQTRGSWGQIDKNYIFAMASMNPMVLSDEERSLLLSTFKTLSSVEFPSLLEQYASNFKEKMDVDRAFLDVVGVKKEDQDRLIRRIHSVLYQKLVSLKETMDGD